MYSVQEEWVQVVGVGGAGSGARAQPAAGCARTTIKWPPRLAAFSPSWEPRPPTRYRDAHSRCEPPRNNTRLYSLVSELRALSLTQCDRASVRECKTGLLSWHETPTRNPQSSGPLKYFNRWVPFFFSHGECCCICELTRLGKSINRFRSDFPKGPYLLERARGRRRRQRRRRRRSARLAATFRRYMRWRSADTGPYPNELDYLHFAHDVVLLRLTALTVFVNIQSVLS